jgi:hypothetical protein
MTCRRVVVAVAWSCAFGMAPVADAQVTTLQNDSFAGGAFQCVQGFSDTETMAARFTAPAALYPYRIERIHVMPCGGDANYAIDIWQDDGAGPNPGSLIWSSGVDAYDVTVDTMNEIVLPQPVMVSSGTVRVGLFLAQSVGLLPGFGRDTNGITAQRNLIHADNGTWFFSESLGLTGDWILRILVTPDTIFEDGFEA